MNESPGAPAFSILVPSFNSGDFIAEALRSVLPQLGPDDEIVVQDGGSTDGTIDQISALHDERIRVRSERDAGQSDALQRALMRARNPIVGWLNCDDLYLPAALAVTRAAWRNEPRLDVVYGCWRIVTETLDLVREVTPPEFTVEGIVGGGGVTVFSGATFFKRERLIEVGGFPVDLHYAMDAYLLVSLARCDDLRALAVPEVLGAYRRQPGAKTVKVDYGIVSEIYRSIRKESPGVRGNVAAARAAGLMAIKVTTRPVRYSPVFLRVRESFRRVVDTASNLPS